MRRLLLVRLNYTDVLLKRSDKVFSSLLKVSFSDKFIILKVIFFRIYCGMKYNTEVFVGVIILLCNC